MLILVGHRMRMTIKLYCYVDETGQDTKGKIFIVVVIIVGSERDYLFPFLEYAEKKSGKSDRKWVKSKANLEFIDIALAADELKKRIYYRVANNTRQYNNIMIETIVSAVQAYLYNNTIKHYKLTVVIDGLNDKSALIIGPKLRQKGLRTEKIKGERDETNSLLRLADAIAGLLRESTEGHKKYVKIKQKLENNDMLTEI